MQIRWLRNARVVFLETGATFVQVESALLSKITGSVYVTAQTNVFLFFLFPLRFSSVVFPLFSYFIISLIIFSLLSLSPFFDASFLPNIFFISFSFFHLLLMSFASLSLLYYCFFLSFLPCVIFSWFHFLIFSILLYFIRYYILIFDFLILS